jgi:hypothetical protein
LIFIGFSFSFSSVKRCILDLGSDWMQRSLGKNTFGTMVRVTNVPHRSELELDIVDIAVQAICFVVQEDLQKIIIRRISDERKKEQDRLRRQMRRQHSDAVSETALAQLGPDPTILAPAITELSRQLSTIVENQARNMSDEPLHLNQQPPPQSGEGGGRISME